MGLSALENLALKVNPLEQRLEWATFKEYASSWALTKIPGAVAISRLMAEWQLSNERRQQSGG